MVCLIYPPSVLGPALVLQVDILGRPLVPMLQLKIMQDFKLTIQQLSLLQYNTLNSTSTYYSEILRTNSQSKLVFHFFCRGTLTKKVKYEFHWLIIVFQNFA